MARTYRVGVIGSTGKGNYGHGLDRAFVGVERAEIVAVADEDPAGLAKTADSLLVERRFADYRRMLEHERLDIVCVGPSSTAERVAMVAAAAQAGCHIYCEKPFLPDLESIDRVRTICQAQAIKLQMAHQWRAAAPVQQTIARLQAGYFGRLLRMRARPKDDNRGGGQELLLHGTHMFDLMFALAGPPRWASGHILAGNREAQRSDAVDGPIGPMLGDSIVAMFGFDQGVRGFFDSTAGTAPSVRKQRPGEIDNPAWDHVFGLSVECERATLAFRQPGDVFIYPAAGVLPDIAALQWEKTVVPDWHFTPEHLPRDFRNWLHLGNQILARDLIAAVEQDREPLSPLRHAAWITEMVQGVYASHLDGGRRVAIPLAERKHPLAALPPKGNGKE